MNLKVDKFGVVHSGFAKAKRAKRAKMAVEWFKEGREGSRGARRSSKIVNFEIDEDRREGQPKGNPTLPPSRRN